MTPSVQPGSIKKPKRIRIRGPQSKNGCFTCKARHIKCDEGKPTCIRCPRSARVCEGYREEERDSTPAATAPIIASSANAYSDYKALIKSNPSWALKNGCTQSERQRRLAQLGMGLLSFDSFGSFGASGAVLDILLPQLCYSIPSVNAAATALGAVYETQASYTSGSPLDEAFAASQYRIALRAMCRDLLTQPYGPIPLMMMCVMLCLTEVFLQQEPNALFHLRGAFKLLQDRRNTRLASYLTQPDILATDIFSPEDDIEILFRTLDFQTCSYALSKTPDLPAIPVPPVLPAMIDLRSARTTLVQLVHACYNFTSTAYKFKYRFPSVSPSMYIHQGRHIAHLSTWLEQFNLIILPTIPQDDTSPSQVTLYSHALTLRMTAMSTLIYLSCILCPYETAYDAHASHFQQIITDAEAILTARHEEPDSPTKGVDGQRFANGPGLVQPLFQTALKYRHPIHRRRAIALLSLAGREGPWSGPREACITSRIMELEETWPSHSSLALPNAQSSPAGAEAGASTGARVLSPSLKQAMTAGRVGFDSTTTTTDMHAKAHAVSSDLSATKPQELVEWAKSANSADIAEPVRVNTMGMEPASDHGRPSNRVNLRVFRCWDMEAMWTYPCGHGVGQDLEVESHSEGPCKDNPYWEMWEEVLGF